MTDTQAATETFFPLNKLDAGGCCGPASGRNLPPPEFSPPSGGSSRIKIQSAAGPPHALRPFRCSPPFRSACLSPR